MLQHVRSASRCWLGSTRQGPPYVLAGNLNRRCHPPQRQRRRRPHGL